MANNGRRVVLDQKDLIHIAGLFNTTWRPDEHLEYTEKRQFLFWNYNKKKSMTRSELNSRIMRGLEKDAVRVMIESYQKYMRMKVETEDHRIESACVSVNMEWRKICANDLDRKNYDVGHVHPSNFRILKAAIEGYQYAGTRPNA